MLSFCLWYGDNYLSTQTKQLRLLGGLVLFTAALAFVSYGEPGDWDLDFDFDFFLLALTVSARG
jgi:hypothetical protein